jgi:hypothetical protein
MGITNLDSLTLGNDLVVVDDASIGGDLALTGSATVGGSLTVTGSLDFDGTQSADILQLGTEAAPLTLTASTPQLQSYSTSALASGTVYNTIIDHTQTALTAGIIEALRVNIDANVQTGTWANAIVGRINYGASGSAAGGMCAPICAELNLPGANQSGGGYYVIDLELNAAENFVHGANASYATAWINCGLWGDATAMGSFEDNGVLFRFDGFTAASGNMISADSQTARVFVSTTARYMVMSQIENGLGLGISGTAMALTNATHAVSIYTSDVATTGTVRSGEIIHTVGVSDVSTIREAFYVNIDSSYTTGDWTNAIVGRINYDATGNANGGMAAAICAEMSMPAAAQSGGAYYALDCEIEMPENATCGASAALPMAFMKFGIWGDATAVDSFEAGGYLFHIDGVADTAGGMFDATDVDDPDFTHALKINIGGTDYFIGLSTSVAFNA